MDKFVYLKELKGKKKKESKDKNLYQNKVQKNQLKLKKENLKLKMTQKT